MTTPTLSDRCALAALVLTSGVIKPAAQLTRWQRLRRWLMLRRLARLRLIQCLQERSDEPGHPGRTVWTITDIGLKAIATA